MSLPDSKPISLGIDTGTDVLVPDERFGGDAGIDLRGEGIEKAEGRDETGTSSSATSPRYAAMSTSVARLPSA